MNREKSEIKSLGLDDEGTVRGRLLGDVQTDDPQRWPKYRRFGIFGEGFEWEVVSATGTTLTVAYDRSDFIRVGDTIDLTRVLAAEPFASTPFTVTAVVVAFNSTTSRDETTVTLLEAVPTLTIDGGDFLSTGTIWPADWQVYEIQSQTSGLPGDVVIVNPNGVIGENDPWCACDLFLCEDLVRIDGSFESANDGLAECRADFTDNGGTITVKLAGYLNAIAPGNPLGTLTFLPPPPRRVIGIGRAVMSMSRAMIFTGNNVACREIDTRNRWFEILSADNGPSAPAQPTFP
ncbi:MAG: hypothetical protein ACKV2Q_24720 [Planctomycetaceae bacterium]